VKRKFWKEFYRINDAAPFLNYRVGVKSLENKMKKKTKEKMNHSNH